MPWLRTRFQARASRWPGGTCRRAPGQGTPSVALTIKILAPFAAFLSKTLLHMRLQNSSIARGHVIALHQARCGSRAAAACHSWQLSKRLSGIVPASVQLSKVLNTSREGLCGSEPPRVALSEYLAPRPKSFRNNSSSLSLSPSVQSPEDSIQRRQHSKS
jgi:hypothetical protein